MNKRAKDWLRIALLTPTALLTPVIVGILLLAVIFLAGTIYAEIEHWQMRREVFEYVIENKESIDLTNPQYSQFFEYADWGFLDAGIVYGYFYSPDDESTSNDNEYRGGYRSEGSPHNGDGWGYYEEICDNWYYYEEHYG